MNNTTTGRTRHRAFVMAATSLALGACSNSMTAGGDLTGSWADGSTQVTASAQAINYTAWCIRATFPAVSADSSAGFTIVSTSLTISSNIQTSADTRLVINAHLVGDSIWLQTRLINLPIVVNDPTATTLPPGRLQNPPVCTA